MLFSLTNISTAFQQFMNNIFSDLLDICIIIYLNNILIYSNCCSNHLSQRQMITQAVNLLSQISSRKFTRELDKEHLLHYSSIYINTLWFMLQQYLPALIFMHRSHILLPLHYKTTMLYTCALTS